MLQVRKRGFKGKILVLTGASRRAIYGRVNQMPVSPFVRDVNPFLGKELPY